MSDTVPSKAGPVLPADTDEIWGTFRSDSTLQDAMARLAQAGFDRADMSLPDVTADPAHRTPEQGAAEPQTEEDNQQLRTLHASMAGSVGAMLAAGVVIATGGAALPAVAVAAAAGLGAGTLAHGAESSANASQGEARATAAAAGQLILAVRVSDPSRRDAAVAAMRDAGAAETHAVARTGSRARSVQSVT
ncbi:MAG: hypothetical protein JO326_14610 [Acetobacteraceae bacterium]|nr:hypothetical protein [Acetobacteraceae bacterium]